MLPRTWAPTERGQIFAPIVPLVVVIYMFLLFPVETRPQVVGVSLPIFRIGLLLFVPFIFARMVGARTRPILADWMIILSVAWGLISFCLIYGFGNGLVRGSGIVIDFAGAYVLGRLAIDSPQALRRVLILISPGLLFAGTIMMIESISGQLIYRPFFADLFGGATFYEGGEAVGLMEFEEEIRLGLARGYGPFAHPILGGVMLTSMLPLYWKSGLRSWPKWIGIAAAVMGLFSVSSAAILTFALGVILIAADWGKRYVRGIGWPMVAAFVGAVCIAVEGLSNRGIGGLIAQFTLNPQTAYYRLLIWEYGSQSVLNHPWIGIGYNPWERPAWMSLSVDQHFLSLAMRNGIPFALLQLGAMLVTTIGTGMRAAISGFRDREVFVGLNFTLILILFASLTVMLFGESNVLFMMLVGIAASYSAGLRLDQSGSIVLDARVIRAEPRPAGDA